MFHVLFLHFVHANFGKCFWSILRTRKKYIVSFCQYLVNYKDVHSVDTKSRSALSILIEFECRWPGYGDFECEETRKSRGPSVGMPQEQEMYRLLRWIWSGDCLLIVLTRIIYTERTHIHMNEQGQRLLFIRCFIIKSICSFQCRLDVVSISEILVHFCVWSLDC